MDSGYFCKNVNSNRLPSHAKERTFNCKVSGSHALKRRAEFFQSRENRIPESNNDLDHRAEPPTRKVVRRLSRGIKAKIRQPVRNRGSQRG